MKNKGLLTVEEIKNTNYQSKIENEKLKDIIFSLKICMETLKNCLEFLTMCIDKTIGK